MSPAGTRAPSPGRGVLLGLSSTTLVPKIKSKKLELQQTPPSPPRGIRCPQVGLLLHGTKGSRHAALGMRNPPPRHNV